MNDITWLDLYNYLYKIAHDLPNLGSFPWNDPIRIHDAATGDEFNCDTYRISDADNGDRFVLAINMEDIFEENANGS